MVIEGQIDRLGAGSAGGSRRWLLWALAALALGAALVLAAFSAWRPESGATATMDTSRPVTGTAGEVVIMSADVGCGPREVRVAAPGLLPITFHNHGTGERTLTIDGVAGALTAEPSGGETTGTFTLERPGTYTFWCATADQGRANLQERWVKGTLIVGDGAAGRP
jgi:plastocyanin